MCKATQYPPCTILRAAKYSECRIRLHLLPIFSQLQKMLYRVVDVQFGWYQTVCGGRTTARTVCGIVRSQASMTSTQIYVLI
jgi:hypothetical protein